MEIFHEFKYFSFSTQLAVLCFTFGTLIFGMYFLLPQNEGILILGIAFVVFAAFFNSIVLLHLFYQLLTVREERENILIKMLIVLSNIPVALIYVHLIISNIKSSQIL